MYLTQLVVTMFKSHEATNMSRKPEVRPYDWECPTINKDDANIVMSAAQSGLMPPKLTIFTNVMVLLYIVMSRSRVPAVYSVL